MKYLSLSFILGLLLGSFIYHAHPIMTLVEIGCVLLVAACFLRKEKSRIYILLSIFGVLGSVMSSYQMQELADRYKTEDRQMLVYLFHQESSRDMSCLQGFRERLSAMYDDFQLSEDNRALVKAMTLGDKTEITKDMRLMYSRTGASHVLALSGMHLAVISALLHFLFMKIALLLYYSVDWMWEKRGDNKAVKYIIRRRISEITLKHIVNTILLVVIWIYVLMVGMPLSLVRAAVMLTICGLSSFIFRNNSTLNLLAISAFIILLVSPLSLLDVGFQMSFMAVLGISVYFRPMQELMRKGLARLRKTPDWNNQPRYLYLPLRLTELAIECILISVSAQILVLPLVAFYFGIVSLSSLLTTAIVSLTAMLIVTISCFCLMVGLVVSKSAAVFISPLLNYVATIQQSVLGWQSHLPLSYLEGIEVSVSQLFLLYIIIICVTQVMNKIRLVMKF